MEAGMHPKALQEILGHKDISITMNIYTNASTDFTSQEMAKYTKKRAEKDTWLPEKDDVTMIVTRKNLTNRMEKVSKILWESMIQTEKQGRLETIENVGLQRL